MAATRPPPKRPLPMNKKRMGPATEATAEVFRARVRGALLGLAVGEALGVTNKSKNLAHEPFPRLNDAPVSELRGGGRLNLLPGQVSCSTQLATVLANTLCAERHFSQERVGRAYARWLPDAPEVGATTKLALDQIAEGRLPEYAGRAVWLENAQRPKENEALPRCIPLAVFLPKQREQRLKAVLEEAAITHFAPVCRLANATLSSYLALALTSPKEVLDRKEAPKVISVELAAASSALGQLEPDWARHVQDGVDWLTHDLEAATRDDPQLYGPDLHLFQHATWARVSFRLVMWELFHAPTFQAAVLDVVNRGGDTDINGAITGALFGALYGEAAIPQEWRETVLEARSSAKGPRRDEYLPALLLNLVGVEPGGPPTED
jgi:ADP-ribosyl-[dinitrogen reductase] hydrolase